MDTKNEIDLSDDGSRQDIDKLRSLSLSSTKDWVKEWTTRDAFREYCQNWKDAIIESFQIQPELFLPEIEEFETEYIARVFHPNSESTGSPSGDGKRQLLGYMHYDHERGLIELANFKAQLKRKMLNLGNTSKENKPNQAGIHGEGIKAASLVMTRKGYHVRYITSNEYWNFRFGGSDNDTLYCHFNKMKEANLNKKMATSSFPGNKHHDLCANAREDVCVQIGKTPGSKGYAIEISEFRQLLDVSYDLSRPLNSIPTLYGTLILDPGFSGKIFLKGLLLENDPERYKYGYNFTYGSVNRERRRLTSAREEARYLCNIWTEAIHKSKNEVLEKYIRLLRSDHPWADVYLAGNNISKSTAKVIWTYLLKDDLRYEIFYHDHKCGDRDVELIIKSLKKRPVPLTSSIWCPLRMHKVGIRTPEEQRCYLLEEAAITNRNETTYAASVQRVLTAALALDIRTQELNVIFKAGVKAELDLLVKGSALLIHEKWLDFHSSHHNEPCWLSNHVSNTGIQVNELACDHVVIDLYDLLLIELGKNVSGKAGSVSKFESALRLRVHDSYRAMPRMITATQGDSPGEIQVSWLDGESNINSRYGLDVLYHVTLHRQMTCSQRRFDLLNMTDPSEDIAQSSAGGLSHWLSSCGCPYQLVSHNDCKVVFSHLDIGEDYFPMVARTSDRAFFGLAPSAVRPKTAVTSTNYANRPLAQSTTITLQKSATSGNISYGPNILPHSDSSDDDHIQVEDAAHKSPINPLQNQENSSQRTDVLSENTSVTGKNTHVQHGHQANVRTVGGERINVMAVQPNDFQSKLKKAFEWLQSAPENSNALIAQFSIEIGRKRELQAENQQLQTKTRADAIALATAQETEAQLSVNLSEYVAQVAQLQAEHEQLKEANAALLESSNERAIELQEARDRFSQITNIIHADRQANARRQVRERTQTYMPRVSRASEGAREKRPREEGGNGVSSSPEAKKARTAVIGDAVASERGG